MKKRKKTDFDPVSARDMPLNELALFLDDRERKFCVEYLVDRNGTQAAIRAGYKAGKNNASAKVQGSRLVHDPRIVAYRRALMHREIEANDVTKDGLLLHMLEIVRRCMSAEPVMEWDSEAREYRETGNWTFDSRGAIKALAEIAKLTGLYEPERFTVEAGEGLESVLAAMAEGNDKEY